MSAISLKRKHKNRISASERWRQWAVVLADVTYSAFGQMIKEIFLRENIKDVFNQFLTPNGDKDKKSNAFDKLQDLLNPSIKKTN